MITTTMLPRRRVRYSDRPARVHSAYFRAAPRCGVTAGTLAAHTPLVVARLAELIAAAAAIPDPAFIERTLAPIDAARSGVRVPSLSPELIQQAQASDAGEEVAETRYLSTLTRPAMRAWLHAIEKERGDLLVLELALKAELDK